MGPQRVLQAAAALVLLGATAVAAPRERVAVIDLGPPDPSVRPQIATALANAGLEPIVDDALAGVDAPLDATALANAITLAQEHFGKLDCKNTLEVAATAIGLAAQRQAAGLAVPELSRAWTLVLLCADRTGDTGRALAAASQRSEE